MEIRSQGLTLIVEGRTRTMRLRVSDDPVTFGAQDVVICALKAHQPHTSAGAFAEPGLHALRNSMMQEARAITSALGITIPEGMMEKRLNVAGSVVGHKISMLQNLERGRSLEIDVLVTAVQEVGRLVVATPTIYAVLALVQKRGRQRPACTATRSGANIGFPTSL